MTKREEVRRREDDEMMTWSASRWFLYFASTLRRQTQCLCVDEGFHLSLLAGEAVVKELPCPASSSDARRGGCLVGLRVSGFDGKGKEV